MIAVSVKTFVYDNNIFEIRTAILGERLCVRVFLNGAQVSPEYSATLEVGQEYFHQHQDSIVNMLAGTAEADVRRGVYFRI